MVGTPTQQVMRSSAIVCRTAAGSNRGMRTRVWPPATPAFICAVCPVEWNTGSVIRFRVVPASAPSSRGAIMSRDTMALVTMLKCVSSAPLGCPVVPEVYRMTAVSSGAVASVGNTGA